MLKLRKKTAVEPLKEEKQEKTPNNKKEAVWSVLWGGVGVCELSLTEKQKLIFSLNQNETTGDCVVDIRIHVTGKKYTGLTSKGITVPVDRLNPLIKKLQELSKHTN